MADWYCAPGGQQIGPVPEDRLREMIRSGQVSPQDAVWRAGMADWVPAATVPELIPTAVPPPPPPAGQPAGSLGGGAPGAVMPLAYATPAAAVGYVMPAPFMAPQYDPGPFERVGKSFKVNGTRWTGMAVASPIAFYLLKVAQRTDSAYVGGLVGYMIAAAIAKTDDTRTCDLNQLPPPVRQALDPRNKRAQGDVIVVRRDAVSRVKTSWMGIVTVRVGSERFDLTHGMFSGGRIRNFLTSNGWTLNADLIPTAAPTYGVGYGRPYGSAPPGMSTGKRVAMIVLGIIIFIVIVIIRIMADTNR